MVYFRCLEPLKIHFKKDVDGEKQKITTEYDESHQTGSLVFFTVNVDYVDRDARVLEGTYRIMMYSEV